MADDEYDDEDFDDEPSDAAATAPAAAAVEEAEAAPEPEPEPAQPATPVAAAAPAAAPEQTTEQVRLEMLAELDAMEQANKQSIQKLSTTVDEGKVESEQRKKRLEDQEDKTKAAAAAEPEPEGGAEGAAGTATEPAAEEGAAATETPDAAAAAPEPVAAAAPAPEEVAAAEAPPAAEGAEDAAAETPDAAAEMLDAGAAAGPAVSLLPPAGERPTTAGGSFLNTLIGTAIDGVRGSPRPLEPEPEPGADRLDIPTVPSKVMQRGDHTDGDEKAAPAVVGEPPLEEEEPEPEPEPEPEAPAVEAEAEAEQASTAAASPGDPEAASLGLTGSEDETAAAARIQSIQRGKLARKDLQEQKDAATKIQAIQRGKQSRRGPGSAPAEESATPQKFAAPEAAATPEAAAGDAAAAATPASAAKSEKYDDEDFDDYEDEFDEYEGSEPPTPSQETKPSSNSHYITAYEAAAEGVDGAFSFEVVAPKHEQWPDLGVSHGTGNSVTACCLVFGGHAVVTGTASGEMTLWALPSGVELCTVHAHLGCVADCRVLTTQGKKGPRSRVVSASHDGTVVVWDVSLLEKELGMAIKQKRGQGEVGAAKAPKFRSGNRGKADDEQLVAAPEAKEEATEEEKAAASEKVAAKMRQRAGEGGGVADWEGTDWELRGKEGVSKAVVVPQREGKMPAKLSKLGDADDETEASKQEDEDPLRFLSMYACVVERHPEHGLGITVDDDEAGNAFVDELVNFPDGSPGAAEQAGVKKGSVIIKIGGIKVQGLGTQAVGAAVGTTLQAGRPLEFELMHKDAPTSEPEPPAPEPEPEPEPAAGAETDGEEQAPEPEGEEDLGGTEDQQGDESLGGTGDQAEDSPAHTGPEWECPECEEINPGDAEKCECCGEVKKQDTGGAEGDDNDGEDAGDLFADMLVVGKNVDVNAAEGVFEEDSMFFEPRVLRGKGIKLLSRISEGTGMDDMMVDEDVDPEEKEKGSVIACQWSPGGKNIVCVFHDGMLQRWKLKKGIQDCGKQRCFANEAEDPTCMCWGSDSDDAARVLIGTSEGRLVLIAIGTMADVATLDGHTAPVSGCHWRQLTDEQADDGNGTHEVVSSSWDGTTRVWSLLIDSYTNAVTEVTQVASLLPPDQSPRVMRALAVSPCAAECVVAIDSEVTIFSLTAHTSRLTFRGQRNAVTSVDYTLRADTPNGNPPDAEKPLSTADGALTVVCSGSRDGTARIWCKAAPGDACVGRYANIDNVSTTCCVSRAQYTALASSDGAVRVWSKGALEFTVKGDDSGDAWCCDISPDAKHLAVGYDEGKVFIYDMGKEEDPVSLEDFDMESVLCCSFSKDGSLLATGGWDGDLRLWDSGDWVCRASLKGHDGQVRGCDFKKTRGGPTLVASSGTDNTVRVWHIGEEKCVQVLAGHTAAVNSVRFTAPSEFYTRLISASDDMSVRLWDADTGKALMTFAGHTGPVKSCAVSEDDEVLTAGLDRTVRRWDITTGDQKSAFLSHSDVINCCTWLTGSKTKTLSVSKDGAGLLWEHDSSQ